MIYFYHGTDIEKSRVKSNELALSLRKKKPDASFFKIDTEHFDRNLLDSHISGQGLFVSKSIVFLDRLCEKKEIKEQFFDKLKEIAASENIFIILEGKIDKASATKIEKNAEKTVLHDLIEKSEKTEYNAFALADAIGARDRKNAWILYRKAIDKGEAPEALHGMMFWKVKIMLVNSYGGAYTKDELYALADRLITVYHDARRGVGEMETGVEALLLSL